MTDPANATLKSHKSWYLQGLGAPHWGGLYFCADWWFESSRWSNSRRRTSVLLGCQKDTQTHYEVLFLCPSDKCQLETLSLIDNEMPSAQFHSRKQKKTKLEELLKPTRWCYLYGWNSPLFSSVSCVSIDSLISQHRADIFIGPKITYGTGCWLLWGWTSRQVDRRPVSADAFTDHIWPLVEHLTACDFV